MPSLSMRPYPYLALSLAFTAPGTSGTTGAVCEADKLCADDCCGAAEKCDNGECVPDCGGPPPCGLAKECCADGDLCYLGECVTPGSACDEQVCVTKPDLNS